jgi:hypothetical protein
MRLHLPDQQLMSRSSLPKRRGCEQASVCWSLPQQQMQGNTDTDDSRKIVPAAV